MNNIYLIGIGTGNPDHLTLEAKNLLETSDLILLPNKGSEKSDLLDLRRFICKQISKKSSLSIREFSMPIRDETNKNYLSRVDQWHKEIATCWSNAIKGFRRQEKVLNLNIALLIWGDPSLYDSSIKIFHKYNEQEKNSCLKVVPGITSLQALAAAHKITLNSVGKPFHVTTGRMLRQFGWPNETETVAVLLDEKCSFNLVKKNNLRIWWGAYLGMDKEILLCGNVSEIGKKIANTRLTAKQKYGWIMDTYILKFQP